LGKKVFLVGVLPSIVAFGVFRDLYALYALLFIFVSLIPLIHLEDTVAGRSFASNRGAVIIDIPVIIAAILIGLLNIMIVLDSVGLSLVELSTPKGFALASLRLSESRYEVSTTSNSGNPVLLSFQLYFLHTFSIRKRKPLMIALVVIPLVVYSLITTEKWILFLVISSIASGILLHSTFWVFLKRLFVLLPIVGAFFTLALILRNSGSSSIDSITEYLLLQYRNLGIWLVSESSLIGDFSFVSFIGILDFIGLVSRDAGVWTFSNHYQGLESNIFTCHRYWVSDFGIVFPILINYSLVIFHNLIDGSIKHVFRYLLLYAFIIGMNTTIFVHNSVFLSVTLLIIEFIIRHVQNRKIRLQSSSK
jgi:hypothetical protein